LITAGLLPFVPAEHHRRLKSSHTVHPIPCRKSLALKHQSATPAALGGPGKKIRGQNERTRGAFLDQIGPRMR
jgi:hypothetical protein